MKKRTLLLLVSLGLALIFLAGCGVKKADIQGKWHIQDASGTDMTMTITEKSFKMDGESLDYKYTGKGTENGTRYISITVKGEHYTIFFPEKDKNLALMLQADKKDEPLKGNLVFAMNKSEKPDFDKYANKYWKSDKD